MSLDLDATPGGPTANSYVTVAAANTLLEGRLHTEPWFGIEGLVETTPVSIPTREAALIWATTLLDTQVNWNGVPTTSTQALAWPMTGQIDHLGRPVPSTDVPVVIQRATTFYALALLRDQSEDLEVLAHSMLASRKIGDTAEVFRTAGLPVSPVNEIPKEVRDMLTPYAVIAAGAGSLMMIPLLRV